MRGFQILILIAFFSIYSCKEDTGFDVSELEPTVNLTFINTDTLPAQLAILQDLNDSLATVNDLINMGVPSLEPLVAELEVKIVDQKAIIDEILSGKTIIDNAEAEEGSGSIQFLDSAEVFPFPLSITIDQTTFFITIGNAIDTLQLTYDIEILEEPGVIRFTNYNTAVSFHSYDSINFQCDSLCISDETFIRLYY